MAVILRIFCLVAFVKPLNGYVRPHPDPFLTTTKCNPELKNRHFVEDPEICDRVLICPEDNGFEYVMYCPEGMVYHKASETCVDLIEGKEYCESRGVLAFETPGKPTTHCSRLPIHSEPLRFVPTGEGDYYKKAVMTNHGYFLCKKGMSKPALLECYHPERPEIILDNDGERKCFPKGALRQYLLDQNEENLPGVAQAKLFKPETRMVTFNGLPIRFKEDYPICPKNAQVRKRFGFGIASRIRHSDDCIHFWTCSLDNIPRKHSCPYTKVFDAESENCIFYKDGETPCNQAYDFESEDIIEAYKNLYEMESLGQSLQDKALLTKAHDFRVKLELLKRMTPGSLKYDLTYAALYENEMFKDKTAATTPVETFKKLMKQVDKIPFAKDDFWHEKKLNVSAFVFPRPGNPPKTEKLDN